jgi:hypothetical protein
MPVRRHSHSAALLVAAALGCGGCATARLPPPEIVAHARGASTYSATLRFSLSGPDVRGRGRAVVAFARPDRLRVEVPGAEGLRLVASVRDGALVAAFPSERAVFSAPGDRASFEALFGLPLSPAEMMDLLVGRPPASLRSYRVRWGPSLPRHVDARLGDGTHLVLTIESPEQEIDLPAAAFDPPPHSGYRAVDASEARTLWSR